LGTITAVLYSYRAASNHKLSNAGTGARSFDANGNTTQAALAMAVQVFLSTANQPAARMRSVSKRRRVSSRLACAFRGSFRMAMA